MEVNFWLIEKLISSTSWDEAMKDRAYERLIDLSKMEDNEFADVEYEDLMKDITENQIDPILAGRNYSQTDILKHLKKFRWD